MRRIDALCWIVILLLAACEPADNPVLTPTRALSGPTLEASPNPFSGGPPTEVLPFTFEEGQFNATVAAAPARGPLPPEAAATQPLDSSGGQLVQVTALDGALLTGELFQQGDARVPAVLLLSTSRADWGLFPLQLQAAGYTALAMDAPVDASSDDVIAMIEALAEVGTVDPARIAVIGAGTGADLAFVGCARLPLCDAAALISPTARDTLLNLLPSFLPRPLLVAASSNDPTAFDTARSLAAQAPDARFEQFDNAGTGALIILNRPDFVDTLIAWLNAALPEIG